jgi:hypothetical protein
MAKYILAAVAAFLLSACMATTPTQSSNTSSGDVFLAWFCYGMYSDMRMGGRNFDFYAYSDSDDAYVNVHGEDVPAKFSMDGLDAQYLFGPDAKRGQYDYFLFIEADGDATYGDYESGNTWTKSRYHCRKAESSR